MESATAPVGSGARPEAEPAPAVKRHTPGAVDEVGEFMLFSGRALRALPRALRHASEVMRLNAVFTRRTSLLLFCMTGFIGFGLANFGFFFLRSVGASDFAGLIPGLLTPRQLGPQMFAYVFAGSISCAIAAELASARIGEEIDAYEAQGVDPLELLVGTRILAALLYVPLATMLTFAGCLFGAYLAIVVILHGNSGAQLLDTTFSIMTTPTILYCGITIFVLTLQCVLVATFYGLRDMGGGADAVGGAVARCLAVNLVLLHFVLALAALVFYGGGVGIPIGG